MATSLRQIELSFQQCCSTYFEKQKVLPTVASPAPAPPCLFLPSHIFVIISLLALSTSAVPPSNGASPAAPTSPTGGREPQVVQMTSDTHTLHLQVCYLKCECATAPHRAVQLAQDRAREAREIERGLREVNQLVTEFGVMVNEGQEVKRVPPSVPHMGLCVSCSLSAVFAQRPSVLFAFPPAASASRSPSTRCSTTPSRRSQS